MTYAVIIPLKRTSRGKSRLQLPDAERSALAAAMFRDTLAAVAAVESVDSVLVVAEDGQDVVDLGGPGADSVHAQVDVRVTAIQGLNEAIDDGAEQLRARGWTGPVAVLPGDLPFLTAADLARALTEAGGTDAVVADAAGTGTTLLVAAGPAGLRPRFGVDSYRRHQDAGARPIAVAAGSTLHMDVDTVADLHLPDELGRLGGHTRDVLARINDQSARLSAQVTVLP